MCVGLSVHTWRLWVRGSLHGLRGGPLSVRGQLFRTLRATAGQAASDSGGGDTARPCFTSEGLDSGQARIPKQEVQKEQFWWEGEEKWQIFQAYLGLLLSLFHLVTKIITFEHLLYIDSALSDADMRMRKTDMALPSRSSGGNA